MSKVTRSKSTVKKPISPRYIKKKIKLLKIAIGMAKELGYSNVSVHKFAEHAKIPVSLIFYYFSSIHDLRDKIIQEGLAMGVPEIIGQALLNHDISAADIPVDKRTCVHEYFMSQLPTV